MTEENIADRVTELRSCLKTFSHPETSPEKRRFQIQQDLVMVAAWGKSTEAKQIDRELRQLYAELPLSGQSALAPEPAFNASRNDDMVKPLSIDKPNSRTNPLEIFLTAFGLSAIPVFVTFGFAASLSLTYPAFISYFVFALGHWAGLAIFFRIAAPGVRFILINESLDQSMRKAGPWLGVFGGFEFGLGCFLSSIGFFLILGNTMGMILFLLAIVLSPIIGIRMGISIARQPLGR